ncbi:hypothetical protein [Rhodococcus sp. SJ]
MHAGICRVQAGEVVFESPDDALLLGEWGEWELELGQIAPR